MEIRAAIADERRRIADLIDTLSPAQLAVPSLCAAWTVQQVAGHLLVTLAPPAGLVVPRAILRSGFRPHQAGARLAVAAADRPPAELARALRAAAGPRSRQPAVLTDLQAHGQDMRRPLGLPHGLALDRLRTSLDFLTGGRAWGFTPRRRLAGLSFEATDLDWHWGTGPVVAGPAEALMMVMTGRAAALGDLDGPGVRPLTARIR